MKEISLSATNSGIQSAKVVDFNFIQKAVSASLKSLIRFGNSHPLLLVSMAFVGVAVMLVGIAMNSLVTIAVSATGAFTCTLPMFAEMVREGAKK